MRVAWPGLLVLSTACHASSMSRASGAVPASGDGSYDYVANLPGQQVRGTMRVIGDSVIVEAIGNLCRPSVGESDPLYIRYTCSGPGAYESLSLYIDRRRPVQGSRWFAAVRVPRHREVCVLYTVLDGKQVCTQTINETYETTEVRRGALRVQRISQPLLPRDADGPT